MIRFARLALVLTGIFSTLILGIRLGIGGRDTSRFSLLFTNPDGSPCQRPCLVGIRTEGMTFNQVRSVLESHPVLRNRNFGGGISASYTARNYIADLDITYGYGSVWPALFTFGDVIHVLGTPSAAAFNSSTGCIDLYFATERLVISNWASALPVCDGSSFDADEQVHAIELLGLVPFLHLEQFKPWRGFGDPRQYALR